jgi:hypothetical protein
MAACAFGEKAHAAVDCGLKAPHQADAQCRAHPARAGSRGTQTTVPAKASAASDTNGARLTPLSPAAAAAAPAPRSPLAGLAQAVSGQAHRAETPTLELQLDHSQVATRVSDARGALGDVMQGAAAPAVSASDFSPPVAWSILLVGLLGLFLMTRGRTVARVQSWATALPPRSGARSGTRASALDRLDAARYAQAPIRRSHQGHFVRAAAASRFS